jgi:hypothetical protein
VADAETMITGVRGFTLRLDGRIPRDEALAEAREHWQREARIAELNLAALDTDEVRVSWWRGSQELREPRAAVKS